jgi:hypothetical protein
MTTEAESSPETPDDLDTLLRLYALERQADAPAVNGMIALLVSEIGLLGLVGVVLTSANPSVWAAALAPLAPLPFMAFGALVAMTPAVRGELIDEYENAIHGLLPKSILEKVPSAPNSGARQVWKGWYGRVAVWVTAPGLLVAYVAVLAKAHTIVERTNPGLALGMVIGCSVATLAVIFLYGVAMSPPLVRKLGIKRVAKRREHPPETIAETG